MRLNGVKSRRKQQGFGLYDLLFWLGVSAGLLLSVLMLLRSVNNSKAGYTEAQNYNRMIADARAKYAQQGSFTGVNAAALINLGIVPETMVQGTNIVSGWNTPVTVAATNLYGTAGDGIEFTFTVPRDQCADFVTNAAGSTARVRVGGTVVKDTPNGVNTIDVGALATQCDARAAGNVAVALAQGR